MRPNLKDVMALLDSVKEGDTFGIIIEQKQWACWSGGPFTMGRDRRKSVRKAIDTAEQELQNKRKDTSTRSRGEHDEEES